MSGAVLVAVAAAIGSFLQGWDNATIAGNLFPYALSFEFYLKTASNRDAIILKLCRCL